MRSVVVRSILLLSALCLTAAFTPWARLNGRAFAAAAAASYTITGDVVEAADRTGSSVSRRGRLQNIVVQLQDSAGSILSTTATGRHGSYSFHGLALEPGDYLVVAENPPGAVGVPVIQGTPNSKSLDGETVRVTVQSGASDYSAGFLKYFFQPYKPQIDPMIAQRDPVDAGNQPGSPDASPIGGNNVSLVQRVTDDGSIYLMDPPGTQLVRLGGPQSEVLLDAKTATDPNDKKRLTRLLQAATNPDGVTALLALREDNSAGIYRVYPDGRVQRAALLPATQPYPFLPNVFIGSGTKDPPIAYLAPKATGGQAIYRVDSGEPTVLLAEGETRDSLQIVTLDSYPVGNDRGHLAVRAHVRLPQGPAKGVDTVLRNLGSRWEVVAQVDGKPIALPPLIAPFAGSSVVTLTHLISLQGGINLVPSIGPDGTVVLKAFGTLVSGSEFVNYYRCRPGGAPQALLLGGAWTREDGERCAFAEDGTVALDVRIQDGDWYFYRIAPSGEQFLVVDPKGPILVRNHPAAFSPDGRLFFIGSRADWPPSSAGWIGDGLFRLDPGAATPVEVARPGQPLPAFGSVLVVPPALSRNWVAFAALLDEKQLSPGPTMGVFRVPLSAALPSDMPLAWKGHGLPNTNSVVSIDDVYYSSDGSLLIHARTDQWQAIGQSILALPGPAPPPQTTPPPQTAPPPQTTPPIQVFAVGAQAAMDPHNPMQLLQTGSDLGDQRSWKSVPNRFVTLGLDKWIFAASYYGPKDPKGKRTSGDGLFTIDAARNIQPVVVNGDHAVGLLSPAFSGLLDAKPSAVVDGSGVNVVFRSAMQGNSGSSTGLFRWDGSRAPTAVSLPTGVDAQQVTQWAAGIAGKAYYLARPAGAGVTSLFASTVAGAAPLLTVRMDVSSLMVNGSGVLFFAARDTQNQQSGVYYLDQRGRWPSLAQDQNSIPSRYSGGMEYSYPYLFNGGYMLRQESACGDLFFEGNVIAKPGAKVPVRQTRGYFRQTLTEGRLETRLLVALSTNGARVVESVEIPDDQRCIVEGSRSAAASSLQQVIDSFAYASRDSDGRWAIYRQQLVSNPDPGKQVPVMASVLIAREGDTLPDGRVIQSLVATKATGSERFSEPLYTTNSNGDVVFWAYTSDLYNITGYPTREALYRYSDVEAAAAS